jgi:hypothetical protein
MDNRVFTEPDFVDGDHARTSDRWGIKNAFLRVEQWWGYVYRRRA